MDVVSESFQRESTRVREILIELLLEHRHYDEALQQIAALASTRTGARPSEEIARACRVPAPGEELIDPSDAYEELDEFDLEPYDDWEWQAFVFARASV